MGDPLYVWGYLFSRVHDEALAPGRKDPAPLFQSLIVSMVEGWRGPVVNWGFFLVIYTIVGLNRDAFLEEPGTLLLVCAIAFASTFVLAEVINRVSRLLGVE